MRYIRTKNGVYELRGDYRLVNENGTLLLVWVNEKVLEKTRGKSWNNGHNVVIAQADTIEELCDEFVKKSKEIGNNYVEIGKNAFEILDKKYHKENLEHYNYYGAIWTDKGLIYVAKMNDKGELELL